MINISLEKIPSRIINFANFLFLFGISYSAFGLTALSGDIAPRNVLDNQLNLGDYLLLKKFVDGDLIPTAEELYAADVAPKGMPNGMLDAGDLIVMTEMILNYEITASQIIGTWSGVCNELSQGEFQMETLEIFNSVVKQSYINSVSPDCSNSWSVVKKTYDYTISNSSALQTAGANIDLILTDVTITPASIDVAVALNTSCGRTDLVASAAADMAGTTCTGGVQYPINGVNHYDLVRRFGDTLSLGQYLDVTTVSGRAVSVSPDRIFTKSVQAGGGI